MQPLVSVVVPAYNEARHISECLESILSQTYQNWECIVANNCSTDGTGDIARQYASRDPRIRVYDNEEFVRAVANFNQSLRRISAAAKYCKIVFADDWIFPECLEKMVRVAEKHSSVGIVGAYGLQGERVVWTGLPYPSEITSGQEIGRKTLLNSKLSIFGTATSLLYRADLVRGCDPFYNESNLHSDSEKCYELLKVCDFGFVHQVLSFTRERQESMVEFSRAMNTFVASDLYMLNNYGQYYLTEEEHKACLDRITAEYYDFLARSLMHRRGPKFWKYHRQKLMDYGIHINRAYLYWKLVPYLLQYISSPKASLTKLLKRKNKWQPEFLPQSIIALRGEPSNEWKIT